MSLAVPLKAALAFLVLAVCLAPSRASGLPNFGDPTVLVGEPEDTSRYGTVYDEAVLRPLFNSDLETLRNERRGLADFDLLHADAARIQQAFGPSPRISMGESANFMHCYASTQPGDETGVLFLVAQPQRVGDRHFPTPSRLEEMQVHADKRRVLQLALCAPSERVDAGLATVAGLGLGMPRAEVHKLLGPPHRTVGGKEFYSGSRVRSVSASEQSRQEYWTDHRTHRKAIEIWYGKQGRVRGFTLLNEVF